MEMLLLLFDPHWLPPIVLELAVIVDPLVPGTRSVAVNGLNPLFTRDARRDATREATSSPHRGPPGSDSLPASGK